MTQFARIMAILLAPLPILGLTAAEPAPTPPPSSFVPAVVYRYLGNTQDLRLANADGSAAILLHRSAGRLDSFDVAPGAVTYIEQTDKYRLMLRTWTQAPNGGKVDLAEPLMLFESDTLFYPDFSPDGSKISFVDFDGTTPNNGDDIKLRVVDLVTGAASLVATASQPFYLRWSSRGDALYYASHHAVTGQTYTSAYTAYRQPISGEPKQELFTKPNIERWDVSRDGTDSLILNYSSPETGSSIPFAIWNGTGVNKVFPNLIGVEPHFACGNAKLLYLSYGKSGNRGPYKVYTLSTGADVIYTRDNNVRGIDWIPCG